MLENSTVVSEDKNAGRSARLSGVELLRIIAIFLICLSHAVQKSENFPDYLDYTYSLSAGIIILKIFRYSGQIGNILFIICSSYFLLDSKRTKKEKAFNLLLDSTFISILVLSGFLIAGHKFTAMEIVSHLLPDFFQNLWFIPVYAVFYVIHPLLNSAINAMTRKGYLALLIVVFFACALPKIFFNGTISSSPLMDFVILYFIVAYMKKYCNDFTLDRKKNAVVFCISAGTFIVCALIRSILGTKTDYFRTVFDVDSYYSPILIPALLSLFNLFHTSKFRSGAVNYLASCTLFVYCFHENFLYRRIIVPKYYAYFLGNWGNLYFLWIMALALINFVGGFILAIIYRETFHRLTKILSVKIGKAFDWLCDKLYKRTEKAETENISSDEGETK